MNSKLQLNQKELEQYYNQNKLYIWHYKTLYQINYSRNNGFYLMFIMKIPKSEKLGVTRRGRYIAMSKAEAKKYELQFIKKIS